MTLPAIGERLDFPLPADAQGRVHRITAFRYGRPGSGAKAYLQAGLHADEFPGMFALHLLRPMLEQAAREDRIAGEILILPQANPLGLTQHSDGFLYGRKETASGENFNRNYPDLAALLPPLQLGPDAAQNIAVCRAAMRAVLDDMQPKTALETMRHRLMLLAHDAALVLDLHADNQALPHIYTGTPLWPDAQDIAAEIGARAVLLAEISGGNPFDEALSGPWWDLARLYPDHPIPNACLSATLEMGSNDDVDANLARQQAEALFRILARRGYIIGETLPDLPPLACKATALTAMAQIKSPSEGLIVYHAALGDDVAEGQLIATLLDPLGDEVPVHAETAGCLFARHSQPYGWLGKFMGKIAGDEDIASRKGLLLTD